MRLWNTHALWPSTSSVRVFRSPSSSVSTQSFVFTGRPGLNCHCVSSSCLTKPATRFSSSLSAKWAPSVQQPVSGDCL